MNFNRQATTLFQAAILPATATSTTSDNSPWWMVILRIVALVAILIILSSFAGKQDEKSNSFRWVLLVFTILLPPFIFWWVVVILAILLTPNAFWWEWVKKMIWDPFWWVIMLLIILWVPFLRMWWWLFLPIMLMTQLKTLYLWYMNWDFEYGERQKWAVLELIPPRDTIMPYKAMEDVYASIWPLMDVGNFRENWCDGELKYGPYWCSWEIASIEGSIHFYIRFLKQHRASIEAALYGHFPDLEIHEVQDYVKLVPPTVPNEEWDTYGEDWDFFEDDVYPLRTYEAFFEPQGEKIQAEEKRIDPMTSLLEAMSKLGQGEHYWVQFITIPVGYDNDEPEWKPTGEKILNELSNRPEKKEKTLIDDLKEIAYDLFHGPEKDGEKYEWARPFDKNEETGEREMVITPGEREVITAIENKLKKPIFRTTVRGVYVAKRDAWSAANRVITRTYMGHFITGHLNHLRFQGKTRPRVHFFWRQRRVFLRARKMFRMTVLRYPPLFPDRKSLCPIFCTEELATLYHFPVRTTGMMAPSLKKIESKRAGPPPNLPIG